MASIIRIKRSTVSGNPSTLAAGELAYSALADTGSNGGDRLYIGMGTETAGNAANHFVIGGKYFTDMMDHTRGTLTASSAILVDSDSKIDQIKVGNMTFTGSTNTVVTADTNGNLNLTPNGTGSVVASKLYVTGTTTFNDNVTPTGNGTVNLGTASNRFGTIYLSGTTIELGAQSLTSNAGGVQLTGNLTTSMLTANIADGTAPFVITSTTRVANLNVATAGNLITGTSNVIVTSSGNVTVGVAGNAAILTITGTGANISGTANISGNANIGNIGTDTIIATTGNVTTINSGLVQNGNSNVTITANANVTITSRSNATLVISNLGANISGYLDVSSNISNANVVFANTFTSNVAIGTAPFTVTSTTRVSNLNVANAGYADSAGTASSATTAGTVTTGSQPNITNVGTLTSLTVSGQSNLNAIGNVKITGGSSGQFLQTDGDGNLSFASFTVEAGSSIINGNSNVSVAANSNVSIGVRGVANVVIISNLGANINGTANVTGNAYVANIFAGGFYYSNGSAFSADSANLVNGTSNVKTAASGNVTVSVAGNANVLTITGAGIVAGNANIGNLSISGYEISSTSTNQNISLNPNGTGNIDVNSSYITNLHEPYNDSDAATKLYVDTVAQGLHIHAPAQVATPANLATITGDTVTYDNGSSGVGATLTLSTAITAIDGITYPTVNVFVTGSRIIVKDEANDHHNGVYTINAGGTILTRATDFDNITEVHGGDFIFVEHGTLYRATGWVQNQPTTTIGGSPIDFLQFAGAGTYTAGTGLTLDGTQFSIATNYVGQSSITTLGNVTTGTWSANAISYAYGGTGQSSYAKGDIVYASATNTLAKLAAGDNGQVLQLASGLPVWGDLDGGSYA